MHHHRDPDGQPGSNSPVLRLASKIYEALLEKYCYYKFKRSSNWDPSNLITTVAGPSSGVCPRLRNLSRGSQPRTYNAPLRGLQPAHLVAARRRHEFYHWLEPRSRGWGAALSPQPRRLACSWFTPGAVFVYRYYYINQLLSFY